MDLDKKNEEWRDVFGYEGRYQISRDGRVYSSRRKVNSGNNAHRFVGGKILKTRKDKCGYEVVMLCIAQYEKMCKVHRLVAEAFLPSNDKDKTQVNHKDGDKLNNAAENLEWVSAQENNSHRAGLIARNGYAYNAKRASPFEAKIFFKRKMFYLGIYKTKKEAQEAYCQKFKELYGFSPTLKSDDSL